MSGVRPATDIAEWRAKVQADADRLWWSHNPILDGNAGRIKRFVAKQTAIGPKIKGGVNAMNWLSHVDATRPSSSLRVSVMEICFTSSPTAKLATMAQP